MIILYFFLLLVTIASCSGDEGSCFFSYKLNTTKRSMVFGPELSNVQTPCLVWFKTEVPGYFRIDINNKIFASKREKKSCLSEYVIVESEDSYTKLCHSNVTVPVEIKYFTGELTILIKWVGELDPSTSYLGRVNFEAGGSGQGTDKNDVAGQLADSISRKLKTFMIQKNQEHRIKDIQHFKYKSADNCGLDQGVVCRHSRFCADINAGTTCNSSLYLCLPNSAACNGINDCLDGDLSDETGCYLPYVLISTGGVVLSMTLLGSVACFIQHHKVMTRNDMVRFNNDLVRRKDKVKARKADQSSKPGVKKRSFSSMPKCEDNLNGSKQLTKNPSKASLLSKTLDSPLPPTPAVDKPTIKDVIVPEGNSFELKSTARCETSSVQSNKTQGNVAAKPALASSVSVPFQPAAIVKTQPLLTFEQGQLSQGENNKMQDSLMHAKIDDRQRSLSRRDKKILADERDIQREIRQRMTPSGTVDKDQLQGPPATVFSEKLVNGECSSTNSFQTQLERLEEVGITPIRRPMMSRAHSNGSMDLHETVQKKNSEEGSRSGYGYRFDFRGSTEFEFTEDAYI